MIFVKIFFIQVLRILALNLVMLSGYNIEGADTLCLITSPAFQGTNDPGKTCGGSYLFMTEENNTREPYIHRCCFSRIIDQKDINRLKDWNSQPIASNLIVMIDSIILPGSWKDCWADILLTVLPSTEKLEQYWGKSLLKHSDYSFIDAFLPMGLEEFVSLYAPLSGVYAYTPDNVPKTFFDFKHYFILNDGSCLRFRLAGSFKNTTNPTAVLNELRNFAKNHVKIARVATTPKGKPLREQNKSCTTC